MHRFDKQVLKILEQYKNKDDEIPPEQFISIVQDIAYLLHTKDIDTGKRIMCYECRKRDKKF